MRKEYGRELRKLFEQQMIEAVPDFHLVKVSNDYFTPGDRAFEKKLENGTSLWISLSIWNKYEAFNVEIGWSKFGRWPELSARPSPMWPDGSSEFSEEEYITRLPFLWAKSDNWFEVEPVYPDLEIDSDPDQILNEILERMKPMTEEYAMDKVTPVVKECFGKISSHGIPYLEKYVEENA